MLAQDEVKKASRVKDEILLPRVRQLLEGEKKRMPDLCLTHWVNGLTTIQPIAPKPEFFWLDMDTVYWVMDMLFECSCAFQLPSSAFAYVIFERF